MKHLLILAVCLSLTAAARGDPESDARAALALSAAHPSAAPTTCACTSPADCSCQACGCANCTAPRKSPGLYRVRTVDGQPGPSGLFTREEILKRWPGAIIDPPAQVQQPAAPMPVQQYVPGPAYSSPYSFAPRMGGFGGASCGPRG